MFFYMKLVQNIGKQAIGSEVKSEKVTVHFWAWKERFNVTGTPILNLINNHNFIHN